MVLKKISMSIPIFYIFGVPDGFNLFHGDADDTVYFQSFYDASKENTKLTIHRRANGHVSYSYLKYRLYSSEGRAGAFFGISIVFNGYYCYDVTKLFRLFDSVYSEVVLKNKVLLEEIHGNPNVQAKFLIRTFNEQELEVRNIESIFLKNIEKKFANDIYPLDFSFKVGKPNLIRKMNTKVDCNTLLEALRNYSWVSISPEYPLEFIDEISEDGKKILIDKSVKIKDDIINIYNTILSNNIDLVRSNINILKRELNDIQKTIQKYLNNQPDLINIKQKYDEIQSQLNDLILAVEKNSTMKGLVFDNIGEKEIIKTIGNTNRPKVIEKIHFLSKIKILPKFKKTLKMIIIIIMIVTFGFVLKFVLSDRNTNKLTTEEYQQYTQDFDKYLLYNDFEKAWKELEKLKSKSEIISEQQIHLIAKVKSEVENMKNLNTIDGWDKAIDLLQKSQMYGNKELEIKSQEIDFVESKRLLQANNAFPQYENVISLCNTILYSTCSDSIKSKATILLKSAQLKVNESKILEKQKKEVKKADNSTSSQMQILKNIVIQISKCDVDYQNPKDIKNGPFKVGEKLIITAKQGKSDANGKDWIIEGNEDKIIEVNWLKNPIRVDLKKAGSVKLKYQDQSCTLTIRR
ncbi:MAG: hypothetical protein IPH98_08185 [Saprospiraceae bacterium]|nr:hypothetical protein [Candidatus Defluviibacterium haderslevense]